MISSNERSGHERFMKMALSFAHRGTGHVSPNPRVGCVIVNENDNDRPIAWGYHRKYGGPHAEMEALKSARERAKGKTVYVNLEPCCHTGKTPPCCDALIAAEVGKVVIGMQDPNPAVAGGGIARLRDAGIEVVTGVLEEECRRINRGFIRRMTLGRPWVTVKAALSLDGNMALASGESKWITAMEARRRAHLLRAENDAVMVGIGTVLRDDPMLNVRDVDGKDPIKVVVDRDLDTPPNAEILKTGKCILFTGASPDTSKASALTQCGAHVVPLPEDAKSHRIPVEAMTAKLAELGMNNLMVEGGSALIGSFTNAETVDEYSLFLAPKLLGNGLNISDRISFAQMEETISMKQVTIRKIGEDFWLEGIPTCSPAL